MSSDALSGMTRETAYPGEGRGRASEATFRRPSGSKKCSSRASPQSKTAWREGHEIVDTTERAADGWWAVPFRVLKVLEVPG
jgi:hypothetical protein